MAALSPPNRESTWSLGTPRTLAVYLCFFLSGAAGLIYQVLWAKYLALYVGSTGLAQIIVLATFMGGLALGSQVLGALADRAGNPLKFYAFLEFGIGVYALLFDRIFVLGRALFIETARFSGLSAGGLLAGKIAACVLTIILPTFLMGGTLPALGRYLIRSLDNVGPRLARLYFLNSFGAVFGCLAAGFYLIQHYGLQLSMVLGAGMNILVGILALLLSARESKPEPEKSAARIGPEEEPLHLARWAFAILLTSVGISGAVSMMYEVAWIRLLTLVLGSSTYSFSLMLATFILGLSLGGFLLSLRRKTSGYTTIYGVTEAGVGLTVLLTLPFYISLPFLFNQISASLHREPATFGVYQFCKFFLCALVMIVPTILQGVTLPAATKVLMKDVRTLGRRVGYIFAVNTVGTLIGAGFAGFVGLPQLGIKGTLELAIALNVILGLLILTTEKPGAMRRWALAGTGLAAALVWAWYGLTMGPWDREVLSAGVYRTRERIPSRAELREKARERQTVFYRDGIDATIAVQDVREPAPERLLVINGKVDASSVGDLPTQKTIAHLPLMLHPNPRKVLVIGVGSGATIGSVLAYDVEQVDVVEISRDVIEASRLFDSVNGRYWEDPRVRVHWEDAKTFLQVTDSDYDVIISEPTNPWIAGVAGVFSLDYFLECRRHLNPGGFLVQWIQAYEMEDATFYMILETFNSVFPCYTLWNPTRADTVLVGSAEPYGYDFERMEARLDRPAVRADFKRMEISSLLPVLAMQMADRAGQPSHIRWLGAVHSDYFPVLEYIAPRGFYVGSTAAGVKLLDERRQAPAVARLWVEDYLRERTPGRDVFRETYIFQTRYPGFFDRLNFAWTREWQRRYPDDPEARVALAGQSEASRENIRALLAEDEQQHGIWEEHAAKLRCRIEVENHNATRNVLGLDEPEQLQADLENFIRRFPNSTDTDILPWLGEIKYDQGFYRPAVSNLMGAAKLLAVQPKLDQENMIRTGLLLCNALLKLADREGAWAVYDAVLKPYEDQLEVWLMRARIRDYSG